MSNGPSLYYIVYALSMLFIGLASKEILVADPALLVAITFLIFSYVAVTKLKPMANEFFESHENTLRTKLTSTLDSFKQETKDCKDQEELLQLTTLVVDASSNDKSLFVNVDLNPYLSGVLQNYIKEDFFLTSSHNDLSLVLSKFEQEQDRRLSLISKKIS